MRFRDRAQFWCVSTRHFISYTLLMAGQACFFFLFLHAYLHSLFWKHSEILVHKDMIGSWSCCRFVSSTPSLRPVKSFFQETSLRQWAHFNEPVWIQPQFSLLRLSWHTLFRQYLGLTLDSITFKCHSKKLQNFRHIKLSLWTMQLQCFYTDFLHLFINMRNKSIESPVNITFFAILI